MKVIKKIEQMISTSEALKSEGGKIGLVPTMGYLHKGHASLIERAREDCSMVIVSIFVNPIQFGPQEDFKKYPRDFNKDCSISEKAGVDYIFYPAENEMYKRDHKTFVEVEKLQEPMCGKERPGHFKGVCTVVLKLFNIIKPDIAYFGQKDYQQLLIIKKMTEDMNIPVEIAECPIVREKDGLAISSRNKYLSSEERKNAVVLFQSLKIAKDLIINGEKDVEIIRQEAIEKLKNNPFVLKIDYFDIRDKNSLRRIKQINKKTQGILIASAIRLGKTRLIDNILIND